MDGRYQNEIACFAGQRIYDVSVSSDVSGQANDVGTALLHCEARTGSGRAS